MDGRGAGWEVGGSILPGAVNPHPPNTARVKQGENCKAMCAKPIRKGSVAFPHLSLNPRAAGLTNQSN